MGLFHFREESPGSVFWHSKGWNLFLKLVEYMRTKQKKDGYQEINTPELLDKSLWKNPVIGKYLVKTCLPQLLQIKKYLQLNQ